MALDISQYAKQDTIQVDLDRSSDKILYSVNQGEQNSRLLWVGLKQYGKTYVIPDNMTAYLIFKKPDGTLAFNKQTVFGDELEEHYNYIAMPITDQMCQSVGDCTAQITLTKEELDPDTNTNVEVAITTCIFKIRVNDSAIGEIMSTDDFTFFYNALNKADVITADAEEKITEMENLIEDTETKISEGYFTATADVGNVSVVDYNMATVVNTSDDPQHAVFDFDLPSTTVEIGTVTTGEPGTQATVTNSGTSYNQVLDFKIPQGVQGIGIGLVPRGHWVVGTYVLNDWVIHNGAYWYCKVSSTTSEPSNENNDWEILQDVTADTPIQFEDYSTTSSAPSLSTSLKTIISGSSLKNLFKSIKSALLRLADKFSDTEYKVTASLFTYESPSEGKAIVTKVTGNTEGAYIKVKKGTDYLYLSSDINGTYFKANERTNFITLKPTSVNKDISILLDIDPIEAGTDFVFKAPTISGSNTGNGDISFTLWLLNSSGVFEEAANVMEGVPYNRVEFTNPVDSPSGAKLSINVSPNAILTEEITFAVSLSLLSDEQEVNGAYIPASFSEPIELDIYEGNNTIVTSADSVIPTVDFKSRFWMTDRKIDEKIDKANIVHNLLTTNTDMVLGADMGPVIQGEIDDIKETLADNSFTITPNTNCIVDSNLASLHKVNKRCDVSLAIKFNGGSFAAGAYYHVATSSEKPIRNTYLASNSDANGNGGSVGSSSAYIDADGKIYIAIGATISNPYFFISGHFFVA
ncbi:hypothetical protein [Konateibacter massiliensis]|uniref:hypothetical protein n=1 Tax=Konateibacter massiliensis TaxID=2002841 RepID=UPI000C1454B7|nr:hypothetical protein [Konateibacter massiliensis]